MRRFKRDSASVLTGCAIVLALTACAAEPTTFEELADSRLPQIEGTIRLPGLQAEVEVIRDPWGVPHIYAQNTDDLFFAQGFVQAQDRLWQMDMYRRAGEGRLSEILGSAALEHDRAARLLKYRGPWSDAEFTSYHPDGRRIVGAFSDGVNAYIDHASAAGELPVEYQLTGLEPLRWSEETPLLRIATAMPTADVRRELLLARNVVEFGAAEANRRARPTPYRDLTPTPGVDLSLIGPAVLAGIGGFTGTIVSPPLVAPYDMWEGAQRSAHLGARENSPGSNNWAISGSLTQSGQVIVANDPHRGVTNPSLRYMVHLDAPGWTAIGSTEPVLPGVAIGHNGRIAWGLTIVGTDQSDVYVETVNPENPNEVMFDGAWEPLRIEYDTVQVKGGGTEVFELKFSRHGPIFHEDTENNLAYAMRSTMHEPGTTGYLPALRLNVADDCNEFLEAMDYWHAPTENMICGDTAGNIAWRAAALSPNRDGWLGRLPVPGTGSHEWDGFRPGDELPTELNPERGWVGTANHDIHPPGYDPPLFFKTQGPYERFARVQAVLDATRGHTVQDSKDLQHDAYSITSAAAQSLFDGWTSDDPEIERFRQEIVAWDAVYDREDRAAAIFGELRGIMRIGSSAGTDTNIDPEEALGRAIQQLRQEQGDDPDQWRWGRTHRSEFPHSLVSAYDITPAERVGGAGTVAATGATFREIIDFSDIDASIATIAPGQSGRPGSPYYENLKQPWADQEYFPLSFSREAVERNAEATLTLVPGS